MRTFCFFPITFLYGVTVYSQEIGIATSKIWTNNYEMENPTGYCVYYSQPIGKITLKLGYISANNKRNYYGFLVNGFLIGPDYYSKESVTSKSTYSSLELSINTKNLVEIFGTSFNVGIGISSDKFGCSRRGSDSKREIDVDEENKLSIFYCISISKKDIFGLPVKLEILMSHKGLKNGNYVVDSEQPFVSLNDIKRLQLNLAYVF